MRVTLAMLLLASTGISHAAEFKIRVFFDDDSCPSKTRLLTSREEEDRCDVAGVWQADGVCIKPAQTPPAFKWVSQREKNAPNGIFEFEVVAETKIFQIKQQDGSIVESYTCKSKQKGRGMRKRYVAKCETDIAGVEKIHTYTVKTEDCELDPRIIVTNANISLASEEENSDPLREE